MTTVHVHVIMYFLFFYYYYYYYFFFGGGGAFSFSFRKLKHSSCGLELTGDHAEGRKNPLTIKSHLVVILPNLIQTLPLALLPDNNYYRNSLTEVLTPSYSPCCHDNTPTVSE